MERRKVTIDGNEAAAYVAHRTNESLPSIPSLHHRLWESGPTPLRGEREKHLGNGASCSKKCKAKEVRLARSTEPCRLAR